MDQNTYNKTNRQILQLPAGSPCLIQQLLY